MRFLLKPHPKPGDIRTKTKFAWFPQYCIRFELHDKKEYLVWLEKYEYVEQYKENVMVATKFGGMMTNKWCFKGRFID